MSTAATSFYVTGGTLQQDAPSYVERQADAELYDSLLRGEFCYILTARQMGKSSLMVHTAARLRQEGVAVAVLDLTAIGQNLSPEQWYDGLLERLGQQLDLEAELEAFWLAHQRLGPLQRWMAALREVVLTGAPGRLVIFVDEIDVVRSLPFSTDEFFAGVRECYNRRTQDPAYARLVFCLLGVAAPSDLIQDTRTSPFNVGRRIELTDFTEAEALPLARGLGRQEPAAIPLLRRVLSWTGGHPYLTQRLCRAVAQDAAVSTPADVDRLCDGLFLTRKAREVDDNLQFVRSRLLRSEVDLAGLLELYRQVQRGRRVADDPANPLASVLRLSGVVRTEGGVLRPRNRIYERVFDPEWVRASMPDAELRRQRAAFRRGLARAAAVASVIVIVMGALVFTAVRSEARARRLAEERQRALIASRRLLYAAQMNLAQQSWEEGNVGRAQQLLEAWRPEPDQEDLRGFEWRYLWRLCHQDAQFTLRGHAWRVRCVAFSPDGKLLASAHTDSTLKLWDVPSRREISTLRGHRDEVEYVAFSPDGKTLASSSDDRTVKLWDVASGRLAATLTGHRNEVAPLAFSPDGKMLASGSWDGTVKLWDLASRREVASVTGYAPSWRGNLAFSPDGRTLAMCEAGYAVWLWDLASRRTIASLKGHTARVDAVAFSPDGRLLASAGDDNTIRLWGGGPHWQARGAAKQAISTLRGHANIVASLAFSPDGKTLVTDWSDGLKLWDLSTKRLVATLKSHAGSTGEFAFSPDGRTLAASGANTVILWNLATRQEVATLKGHTGVVHSVAFSPDGNTLASTGSDGTVRLWHATPFQETDSLRMVAAASDRTVLLEWRPVPAALGYNVYRGPAGARHAQLRKLTPRPVGGSSFTDRGPELVNGRPQTYVVAAIYKGAANQVVEGPPVRIQATPSALLPGFMAYSLNEGSRTGSVVFDAATGVITLRGSGENLGNTADGGYFMSRRVTGDFQITVTMLSRPTGTQPYAKGGLMVRESLAAGARDAYLVVHREKLGLCFEWRPIRDDECGMRSALENAALTLPITLRLTRHGDSITAEYSTDGGQQFQLAGGPLAFAEALPQMLYAGLAITANDPSKISEARFRDLQINGRP